MNAKADARTLVLAMLLGFTCAVVAEDCTVIFDKVPEQRATITASAWNAVSTSPLQLKGIDEAAFVLIAPTTQRAFENAFGDEQVATSSNLRKMQALAVDAKRAGVIAYSSETQGTRDLEALLKDSSRKLIVIAGHNEDGNLKFPDGTSVRVSWLISQSNVSRLIIVVACNAKNEAPFIEGLVDGQIKATDALAVIKGYAQETLNLVKSGASVTYKSFVKIERTRNEAIVRMVLAGKQLFFRARVETRDGATAVTLLGPCNPSSPECKEVADAAA